MRTYLLWIFIVVMVVALHGHLMATAQLPDILIYKGEKISLRVNPLESYYSKTHPRPKSYFENPVISSACWRGYVATWEIVDNHLFLTEIRECHGKRTASLEKFFPTLYKNGRVPAKWYSGLLKCPRGKLVKYEHMSYRSEHERELLIEIKQGRVLFTKEYGNLPAKAPSGYTIVNLHITKMMLPESIFPCPANTSQTNSNTKDPTRICFENRDKTLSLSGRWERNIKRVLPNEQPRYVNEVFNKQLHRYNRDYTFNSPHSARGRWGYYTWTEGFNSRYQSYLRIFVMANRSNTITLFYTTTKVGMKQSKEMAEKIFKHVKLRGY